MYSFAANNRKIARNTIYIYVRTIVVLVISLYTSRVVLEALGIVDYGIYNVVAGIIALIGFFQTAQSKSTSRFITFELGSSSVEQRLKQIFSASMTIHIYAALFAVLVCETIGLYAIIHWIDIPSDRQVAAHCVYQFAILTLCIHLLRIPYDAVVIAHEEMSVFAYFSIIEVALQLVLVFVVKIISFDKLIVYAALMMLSAFFLLLLYYFYVRYKYKFYRYKYLWDKKISTSILKFSGWTLLGTGANVGTQQGTNILMNNYVGLVANASIGIASQVNAAVSKFVGAFSTAFTPQIIKLYAQNQIKELNILISRSSKFSFALCYLFTLPLLFNMDFIMSLWLGKCVPEYASDFCRMILICTVFDATTGVYNTAITATGRIKSYQACISLSFCIDLIFSFILLYIGVHPVWVFSSRILTRGVINMIIGLYFIKHYINFDVKEYWHDIIGRILFTIILTTLPVYLITFFTSGWTQLLLTLSVGSICLAITTLHVLMTVNERKKIVYFIQQKMKYVRFKI